VLEKNAVTESRIIYVFQATILLFAIFLAKAITSSFFIGIAIVIVGWWAGLACFASQPIGGAFQRERKCVSHLLEEQTSVLGKRVVQGVFYGLYWPIFISKNAYFIFIISAGVIYYGVKYLHE